MIVENHIGIFKNALSKEVCESCIEYFELTKTFNKPLSRQQMQDGPTHLKDDETIFMYHDWNLLHAPQEMIVPINSAIDKCYSEYVNFYSVLMSQKHVSCGLRLQKTSIGGGYHLWHFENDTRAKGNRLMAFMFYLNEVCEGGETEFLYEHKRLKPEAGTFVLWPATYTHAHRGNPPISNEKYIVTGWLEY